MAGLGAMAVAAETPEPQTISRSCADLIAGWRPFQALPPTVTLAKLEIEIALADDDLRPCGYTSIKTFVGDVIAFARAFDLALGTDVAEIAKTYAAGLADVPDDLLQLAMTRIRRTWRWARIPLPADVRAAIETEHSGRRVVKLRLEWARTQLLKAAPKSDMVSGPGVGASTSIDDGVAATAAAS